jgi:hypothetical protein
MGKWVSGFRCHECQKGCRHLPKRLGKPITRPLEPNSFLPLQIIMRKFIILLLSCFHLASGNYDFFKHIYFFAGFGSELRIGTSNSMTSTTTKVA